MVFSNNLSRVMLVFILYFKFSFSLANLFNNFGSEESTPATFDWVLFTELQASPLQLSTTGSSFELKSELFFKLEPSDISFFNLETWLLNCSELVWTNFLSFFCLVWSLSSATSWFLMLSVGILKILSFELI